MHVVLVHGMGGSPNSWSSVTPLLDERGLSYSVADNLSQSLADDVANVHALVDAAGESTLLVGHSYGGAVITNAGHHEQVRGLVYIAAFAPDDGESVRQIVESYPPAEVSAFMKRGADGEWITDDGPEARAALAWDVPESIWMAGLNDRRPSSDEIFTAPTGTPAWATRPSWYLVASHDKHIGPQTQRDMARRAGATVSEVATSHAIQHAAPANVVDLIETAISALAH